MMWNSHHLCIWRHISVNSLHVIPILLKDDDHLEYDNHFVQKSENWKFWPSRRFSHETAYLLMIAEFVFKSIGIIFPSFQSIGLS